jgi:energy-coupling factor transport system substrate-specific component
LIPLVLANVLGVAAITWPLLLGVAPEATEAEAHSFDAPIIVALLVPLLILVALDEAKGKRRTGLFAAPDARLIALLGALVAVNAFLRIPKGPSGEGLVFVLPILAGWFIGGRFGFLLGAFTIPASAVITGGVGPWLPFQMFALGWVGACAGLLRRVTPERLTVPALGVYAYVSSVGIGFVMSLWFWPFLGQAGPTFFEAGLSLQEGLVRFVRFYILTSLPWDTGRALLANVPLVVILARPVGNLFVRFKERFAPEIVVVPKESEPAVVP